MKLKITKIDSEVVAIDGQNSVIKSGNDYVWCDEKANFLVSKGTTGSTNPTWEEYLTGFEGLVFSGTALNQVWVDFHIDHDIALNTKVYPHIHWMPLTNLAGTVRWGLQYMIAKGHGQSAFSLASSTTVYIDHTFPAGYQYRHMVSEVSDLNAILSSQIEPDSVVKMRVFRDGAVDSYNGRIHAWQCDLHYQIARLGTVNKAPNFYGS